MNKIKTRDKNFIRKGERGSVTLFVLIAMMFFLTVGVGVYMANVNTQQAQQKGVKKVQLEYSSTDNIDNIYKDQVEKLGQKLIIVVKDSENKIYQEGTWTNKLPLTIIANWPDGTKESEKEVSLTSPSKVAKKYSFDKENTALILNNEDNNIENGKWTAQVEVAGKKQSVEIWIDTTAPTCTITSNPDKNPTNADSITFTLKNEDLFSELVSDIDYSKLENIITVTDKNNNKLENGSDVTWDWIENEKNKVKFTINKDDFEGNIKITIPADTLTDNAGNKSGEITKEVKIDKKAPTCTITANPDKNPTNASSIVYTFKWSEEVTGFTTEDITVTNGTKGIFTAKSATEYTLAVTTQANQNNTQTINVAAGKCTDIAENGNIAVNKEVKIDRVTPTCTITANPDKNPTNASSITYTFTWSEEVTGFTTEDITVTKGTKGTFTKTSGTVYTLVVTTQANQDNTQTINVAAGKCTDIAGNENAAISKEVKIDRKSPTCTITANPNTSPTNASSITYTFTWSEEVTGFTTEDITVTNGTKGTFTKTSGTVYTLVVTTVAKQDNTQKVVINTNVCTDVVGNVNIAASKEVKIDRKAPTATSCEVKNITATGYDVYVYGVTDSTGVDRVLFPTWTQNNGQDDIQANWWETTNDTAKGKNLGNGTWHYRVNVTDHKNEYGTYTTHVYTYDTLGNKQICSSTNIEVPAVNITYLSDNLVYGLENRSSTTDHNMTYSISNGVVTVTANASDGWGNTTGRVYLEANTQYEFTCTTSATSGTWGNSVEAFLLLNGSTSTYIRMDSNNNYRFTPAQSGTYYIRLDVNTSGKTYTFSNIDVRKIVLTENKNYGLTLTTLPDYSRTGYTFNGWFTAKTGGTKIATTTPVPGVNTTYYAQTKANTYTVKYDGNGATSGSTASSSHTYNVAKALTANGFAKTGYSFNGWNTKADGTGTSYANSASVINLTSTNGATVTLYAQWKINQYNIDLNYNVDGTTYWSGYQGRIKAGLKIGGVDKGYVADYGGSSNYGTSWEIYGLQLDGVNVAYTQKGTLGASNLNLLVYFYTISFKADSATYGSVSASSVIVPKNNTTYSTSDKTFKLSDGRTVTASTKSVTGYTSNFTGWSSTTGTITAATSITAKFSGTLITYTIGYTLNGGTVSGNPTSYNITTDTITLKNPTRTGYTFAGWTGSNGTTKQTTVTIPKGSTGNKTYTANWTANTYTINLNNQSATTAGTTAIYEKYNVGIYKESACTNKMTTTANAITKPERKYTVTFNYNGSGKANTTGTATWTFGGYYTATAGSGTQMINASGNVTDNLTSTKYTATATLYANWTGGTVSLPTPTRTGYTFAGWYTAASGGTKIESTSKITSAQTLYAHWTDTTAPTVTFGTNGNTTYAKSQSTTVTVTDSGSGVNTSSLKYQWTQSTTAPAESTFSTTFTSGKAITKNTGTGSNWYLWILAKDNAGNKTIKRSNAFYLDNTAPTASVSPTAPVAKNKVTITLKDANSKVKYWAVTTSTTAPTTTSTTATTNTSTLNTWYPVTAATQVSTTFTPGTTSKYYVWVKDSVGNGATAYAATFTPTPANYEISKSGATTYYETTLANATANAVTGSTIKVLNSVTESTDATIEEGKSLTINTNQKTITMNNCYIKNNGSLVVKGQGTIKCSTGKSEGSVIFSTGNLTIGSVTIVNTVGEGIYAGGTMNMSAGTVTGKTAGIEVTGTTTITGGTVSATGSNEGAIEPGGLGGNATININGGTITGDYGVCQGGQRVETAQVIVNIGATSGDVNGGPVVKGNKNAIGMSHGGTVNFYQGKLQGGTERVSTIPFSAIRSGYMVYLDNTSSTTVHTISLKPTSFGTAVAMINNINYYTIQAAIECCGTYETTIEQINDITSGSIIAQTAKDHNIIWTKKVGNYTSKVNATGTMVVNNGKLTMKLIYIEIKGGTASPIITNNGDLTLYGGSYYNNVNSASIINNQGSGNVTTKEAAKIYGNGYGIYSSSLGTVSVTSLSKISGGTYGIYSSSVSGGKIVVNQGCVEGITFGIYTKGSCDITFGTLGTGYNNISGIQAMGTSNTSVNITGDQGQIINSNGIAIETSGASVNIDDENATIQGKTYGIKTFSGNITVKKGIVKATGTAAPGILTRSGSVTLGVNDGTVSTTIPAITGNGNAAIVKEDPKTGTMAVYDGVLTGAKLVISASAAGAANYESNGGTILKPTGYKLDIKVSPATLTK